MGWHWEKNDPRGSGVMMVLNGMKRQQRADESARLMDYMFREYKNYQLFAERMSQLRQPISGWAARRDCRWF